jgi:hypothetical protein
MNGKVKVSRIRSQERDIPSFSNASPRKVNQLWIERKISQMNLPSKEVMDVLKFTEDGTLQLFNNNGMQSPTSVLKLSDGSTLLPDTKSNSNTVGRTP